MPHNNFKISNIVQDLETQLGNSISIQHSLSPWLDPLKFAIKSQDDFLLLDTLRLMATEMPDKKFQCYLLEIAEALESNNWQKIGRYFKTNAFIYEGLAFLLAPYRRRVNQVNVVELTLVVAKVCSNQTDMPERIKSIIEEIFGHSNQIIPKLILVETIAVEGNIGGNEAFMVPGGWKIPFCLDMNRQKTINPESITLHKEFIHRCRDISSFNFTSSMVNELHS